MCPKRKLGCTLNSSFPDFFESRENFVCPEEQAAWLKGLENFTDSETYLLAKFADWLKKIPGRQNTDAVSYNTYSTSFLLGNGFKIFYPMRKIESKMKFFGTTLNQAMKERVRRNIEGAFW